MTRVGPAEITGPLPPDLGLGIMQPYRCYFLDSANHIVKVEAAQLADDIGAVEWSEDLHRRNPAYDAVELWCRDRLIARRERRAH